MKRLILLVAFVCMLSSCGGLMRNYYYLFLDGEAGTELQFSYLETVGEWRTVKPVTLPLCEGLLLSMGGLNSDLAKAKSTDPIRIIYPEGKPVKALLLSDYDPLVSEGKVKDITDIAAFIEAHKEDRKEHYVQTPGEEQTLTLFMY